MRKLLPAWYLLCAYGAAASAGEIGAFDYDFTLNLERSALDGLSLGDDQAADRLVEEDYEFEFALEYQVNESLYLFFTGALTDESETVKTANLTADKSGLERREMGLGYYFGERLPSELDLGRMEFKSASEWWIWWDEELDAVRLQSSYRNFDAMLALAEEQAPAHSDDDFIDPEFDGVRRTMLSLAWAITADQSVILHYLDQRDGSESFDLGEFEDFERIDEEDADLSWTGIDYLADFDLRTAGELQVELHAARVSGDETVYEFGDPAMGQAEVEEKLQRRVGGSAYGWRVGWTPAQLDELTLILGQARGDGDPDPGDGRNESFRQTGLQGDSESFGELYQPELSNLDLELIGIEWRVSPGVMLALLNYRYRQLELADEMRDVSIELDPGGASRELGRETDLVVKIDGRDGLELIITLAEFRPGSAYGGFADETSNFIKLELDYEF